MVRERTRNYCQNQIAQKVEGEGEGEGGGGGGRDAYFIFNIIYRT